MATPDYGFADLDSQGIDPQDTAEILSVESKEEDVGTRDGAKVPATGSDVDLRMSEDEKSVLAAELVDLLTQHDAMMVERWERDRKVEDSYALMGDGSRTGQYPGAAQMVSELTMSAVDQAKARVARAILDVQPIMKVDPIETDTFSGDIAMETAAAAEDFLENYARDVLRIDEQLPLITLRCTKIGTAVLYVNWKDCKETFKAYAIPSGKIETKEKDSSRVTLDLLRNQDVVLWPPWIQDWQEDYEIVGHRTQMTVSQWVVKARYLGLTEEETKSVSNYAQGEVSKAAQSQPLIREGIDPSNMASADKGLVSITELWCNRLLPGEDDPYKYQIILHEGLRKILWIDYNRLHSQKHPYFPIRYKRVDGSAWGTGLGHEIVYCQMADDAFRNLEIDNLMSSSFSMVLLKQGTAADAIMDRPYPGIRVPTEDPQGDINVVSLATEGGAALALLYQAMAANEARKTNASGLSPVLAGQGDPTMKSGAGTGSTMALIEQAGKKFGDIDQSIRTDWTRVAEMALDLVAQFASDGVLYAKTSNENAALLKTLRYVPVQGKISDYFRIRAHAPSAANNKELSKQNLLVVYQFLMQHIQMLTGMAQQYYQATNPAGWTDFLFRATDVLNQIGEKVMASNEIPGTKDMLPDVDPPTPEQEQINELTGQVQQLTQQAQQMQMQAQQAQMAAQGQPPQPPGMSPGGGMPPEQMPPGAM